ncbi:class I SAM-dependent methyltransferase [Sphingobacterium sp. SGG-5]|uniref:class I SAM-dependent methyltransferase n=1 Tax=Sphingobacterium sp. SGG-5 TaxID=2710881 RepID=UPI0013EBEC6E|nr:class I SAM-dependent methyltransferase [Sphingobacterium sp. SGG-5]NGM60406.1 class I SAM-dependent methyltransferase [Sphingobacterium sp. SGG-5]
MQEKSTLKEIQERFDNDVERFSNLETGQQTTLDASFNMQLIAEGIAALHPAGAAVLDIGCGAGNYDVKLLEHIKPLDITLVDLSKPMLDRAKERVDAVNVGGTSRIFQGDFRSVDLPEQSFDVIISTAVLHHLRDDIDWRTAFAKFYSLLKPGGSFWIFDLVEQATASLQELIYTERYGQYLTSLKDEAYRDHVFAYIEKEDSPRSLMFQLDLLRETGFRDVDVLHKNLCFASFVAFK